MTACMMPSLSRATEFSAPPRDYARPAGDTQSVRQRAPCAAVKRRHFRIYLPGMQEPVHDAGSASVFECLRGTRPIVVAGHSHVVALTGRLQSANLEMTGIDGFRGLYYHNGPWPRDAAYWQALARAPAHATIVLFWCGNEHNAFFLIRPEPLFDFVPAGAAESAIDERAVLVPESLVRAKLSPFTEELRAYLKFMTAATKARLVVAGSPPPKGDNAELKRLILSEWYYRDQAERLGIDLAEARMTPRPIRLKLWRVTQDLMAEAALSQGCDFFPVPEAAFNEDGFLRRKLWADDATHANAQYGRIMLEALANRFGS
jgi:hypothetical protein